MSGTELRKYKGVVERHGRGFISPAEATGCEPHLEEVSATDDRDIQPLVEAARAMLSERFTHEHVVELKRALRPFVENSTDLTQKDGKTGKTGEES